MQKRLIFRLLFLILILSFYASYVVWNITNHTAPIDYLTFMETGHRLRTGQAVYGENSFYPLPFVMVFSLFDWLPRELSLAIWLLAPVLAALAISGFSPITLLYAPLIGHFLGGQSAVFGMLGFWGYRKNPHPDNLSGGIWLALTTIKPQLAIAPCLWAFYQWWKTCRSTRRVPRQALGFFFTSLAIYLPAFLIFPDWVRQWLSHPRPLYLRALSGFFPRALLLLLPQASALYWVCLVLLAAGFFLLIWFSMGKKISLDVFVVFSFVVNPLVHDYDLILLLPMLENVRLKILSALLSVPAWVVLFTQYANDSAWMVFTLFAPAFLAALIWQQKQEETTSSSCMTPPIQPG